MIIVENVTHFFDINWVSIKNYVNNTLKNIPAGGNERWGGWSVLSKSGNHLDGWGQGFKFFKISEDNQVSFDKEKYDSSDYTPSIQHTNFTNIVNDDIKAVVSQMRNLNLNPYRTRITKLNSGKESVWHVDSMPDEKKIRIHFVIDTNDQSFFEHKNGKIHLDEKNVYLINVNGLHRVTNMGNTDRIHIISDITNVAPISKLHI